MIFFDNHKIDWKFADLLRDDWQSLRERMRLENRRIVPYLEIFWKIANIQFTTLLNEQRLLKKYSIKVPLQKNSFFSKQHTGSNIDAVKGTALKEFVKFPGRILDWIFYWKSLWANSIPPQVFSCKFMMVFTVSNCI